MPVGRLLGRIVRICLIVVACLAVSPARAQESVGLYEVDVPVADQSPAARQQAARNALAVVLMRLTGLGALPDDPRIRRAVGNPDGYYVQFGYAAGAAPGELQLRVQFSPQALFQLIRETGLPIWPSARPVVLAWLLVDDGEGVRVPDAEAADPIAVALLARARERGLVVKLARIEQPEPPPGAAPAGPETSGSETNGSETNRAEADGRSVGTRAAGLPPPGAAAATDAPEIPEPAEVVLHPAAETGGAVQATVGLWDAPLEDLQALARAETADIYLVARLSGVPDGAWSGTAEIHERNPQAAPPDAVPGEQPAGESSAQGAGAAAAVARPGPDGAAIASAADEGSTEVAPGASAANDAAMPAGPVTFETAAPTADALGRALVDQLIEHLLIRYQVQAGDSRIVAVTVRGIRQARDYAEVLRLFGGVEVVDDVAVLGAAGDQIRFALTTIAGREQLLALVTADSRLVVDEPAPTVPQAAQGDGAAGGPARIPDTVPAPDPGPAVGMDPAAASVAGQFTDPAPVPGAAAALELLWQGN